MVLARFAPLAALALAAACASHEKDAAPPTPAAPASNDPPSTATPKPSAAAPTAASAAAPSDDGPRVYAKTRFVWVHPEPNDVGWIGYLWFGGSVKLKSTEPVNGPGCDKWYAIEPRGYVCVDGQRATLDPNDPLFKKIAPYAPDLSSPWPHRYAESRGLYRYDEIPSKKEQHVREWDLDDHLKAMEAVRNGTKAEGLLEGVDLTPATAPAFSLGPLPLVVHEQRRRLPPLSTVAYSAEVEKDGRSWLLSADLYWVAKDRVAPYPKVTFEGVHLGHGEELPLAFFRGSDRPQFQLGADGRLSEIGARFVRLSHVALSGKTMKQDGASYYETKLPHIWVKKDDAVIPTPQEQTPWGAPVNGADTKEGPEGRRTWLEASVWKGWLIAYEGTKPVFVTMISPGRGGTPERGKDPISTASTPVGTFPITGKFATATMVAPNEFIHSDVPWTQNFHGAHALHGAYWHDNWGNRMSGGCVNVSPIDGKWLFEFTEPPLPPGWHGVRWRPNAEPATRFVVHD